MKRFWDKVNKTDTCWLWTAGVAGAGYGTIRMSKPRRYVYAHRLSYEMHFGPIPPGMEVCHRCDVTRCVNPDHLFLGTHAENVRDCVSKGRQNSGGKILSPEDIPHIRRRLAAGEFHHDIAKDYGVCRVAITNVASGRTWGRY